jgi:HTH-type transcriptional regulator / antitoxin HipB
MKKMDNLQSFESHLDEQYGVIGTASREAYQKGFETFKIGVLIEIEREKQKLTQAELALKCGTNKSYISRIENGASDIRLSTLIRIIEQGLGGKMKVVIDF